jgi:hypothetical protein
MIFFHHYGFTVTLTGYGTALFNQTVYGKISGIAVRNKARFPCGMKGTIKLDLIHIRIKLFPVETDFFVKQILTHIAP